MDLCPNNNTTQKYFGGGISTVPLVLTSCDVPESVLTIITDHLHRMVDDCSQRISDLSAMDFPDWHTHFSLVDLGDIDPFARDELTDLQNDNVVASIRSETSTHVVE